jgi:hypothetical protein
MSFEVELVMKNEVSYYQYQKDLDYPVFVRFEDKDFELRFTTILDSFGFKKLTEDELKTVSLEQSQTKVLRIQKASLRVSKQIDQGHSLDNYGPESITPLGSYDVYKYKGTGMLIFGGGDYFWELGVKSNVDKFTNEIKTMMVRYLSWALAPKGIIGFWGSPVDEGIVVMKPKESNFESIFIDVKSGVYITQDGVKDMPGGMQILRLDESLKGRTKRMSKEELISFLSTNNCYFSYQGLDTKVREAIYEFVTMVDGYVYPVENFKPRNELGAA